MSEEPIDDIELEEAEPVDGSFLDVSLVEEVNSNSQESYCCGVRNKVFRRKAHLLLNKFHKGTT
jgi:transposase